MEDYVALYTKMLDELRSNSHIRVSDNKTSLEGGLTREEIMNLSQKYGVALDDTIVEFYTTINGASLEWLRAENSTIEAPKNGYLWGTFVIYDLESMLRDGADVLWHYDMDPETLNERKKLRIFDFFNIDTTSCVCFLVENQRVGPNLVLHEEDAVFPLNMNLPTYMNQLTKTRGMYGWQHAMIKPKGKDATFLKKYMPLLFNEPFP